MTNEIVALTSKAAGCPTYGHVSIRNFLLDSQSFFTRASLGTAVSIPFSVASSFAFTIRFTAGWIFSVYLCFASH